MEHELDLREARLTQATITTPCSLLPAEPTYALLLQREQQTNSQLLGRRTWSSLVLASTFRPLPLALPFFLLSPLLPLLSASTSLLLYLLCYFKSEKILSFFPNILTCVSKFRRKLPKAREFISLLQSV